jgi:hypothetical protein
VNREPNDPPYISHECLDCGAEFEGLVLSCKDQYCASCLYAQKLERYDEAVRGEE